MATLTPQERIKELEAELSGAVYDLAHFENQLIGSPTDFQIKRDIASMRTSVHLIQQDIRREEFRLQRQRQQQG